MDAVAQPDGIDALRDVAPPEAASVFLLGPREGSSLSGRPVAVLHHNARASGAKRMRVTVEGPRVDLMPLPVLPFEQGQVQLPSTPRSPREYDTSDITIDIAHERPEAIPASVGAGCERLALDKTTSLRGDVVPGDPIHTITVRASASV